MRSAIKLLLALLLGLALLTALVQWRAARHEARAEASHPPEGEIITVDGLRFEAAVSSRTA